MCNTTRVHGNRIIVSTISILISVIIMIVFLAVRVVLATIVFESAISVAVGVITAINIIDSHVVLRKMWAMVGMV